MNDKVKNIIGFVLGILLIIIFFYEQIKEVFVNDEVYKKRVDNAAKAREAKAVKADMKVLEEIEAEMITEPIKEIKDEIKED
jgi:Na+-transporting methylmalonyl-CoA/oxaloacetate decarboxylase gamma subunit